MIKLRDYQNDLIVKTRHAMRAYDSVLLQAPTGSGKTALAATMLANASYKGKRSFFIVHRQELIDQTSETFDDCGIPYGVIASGYSANPFCPIQICSINTLKNRVEKIQAPDFIIWDEAHHCRAKGWQSVKSYYSGIKHVGLTATPCRLDGKGLDSVFDYLVLGPSVSWLIENKYLSDYKAYAPTQPDMSGVHRRMGDFVTSELEDIMDKPSITGDAIAHYKRLAEYRQAIIFCASVQHGQHVTDQFNKAGYKTAFIDGKTPRSERRQIVADFKAKRILNLCNVEIVGEGFNMPAAEAMIGLRPTESTSLFLQQVGRVLRPKESNQPAIILDHAGNLLRHGLPDDDREWILEGQSKKLNKKENTVKMKQCERCYFCHHPSPKCPNCGAVYEINAREIEEVDGNLQEIDKAEMRRKRKSEQANCRDLNSLIELGKKRGYSNPVGWAAHLMSARNLKQKQYRAGA